MAQLPIAIKATAEQERLERQATEDLAAALQKWAAALLRNVNSFNLNTMLDRLNNPRWAGNIAMRDALIAIMQRAAEVGVDAGVEALYSGNATKAQPVIDAGGVDWELVNVDAAEWALNYSHLLMNDISSTTRRAIQREIAYYVENSMTINQLRDRIMSLSTFSETRANRIAVTETTRAYAEGNMRAWSDLDYVERVRWQTANDDLVCPICGPLNQQTVAKGELFAGRYYSPPAHVNCRCGVSPVVTGAEDAGAIGGGVAGDILPEFSGASDAAAWLRGRGVNVAYTPNEVIDAMWRQFEIQHGDGDKDKFYQNWSRLLSSAGTPDAAFVDDAIKAIARQHHAGAIGDDVTYIIRNVISERDSGYALAEYADGVITYFADSKGGVSSTWSENRDDITTSVHNRYLRYYNNREGALSGVTTHEYGHHLERQAGALGRAQGIFEESRQQIKRDISYYAGTNAPELAAESYALKYSPDYGTLSSAAKNIIRLIWGD